MVSHSQIMLEASSRDTSADDGPAHVVPRRVSEGVWMSCDGCHSILFRKEVERNLHVCPHCQRHFPIPAAARVAQLLDAGTFEEWYAGLKSGDPLGFHD